MTACAVCTKWRSSAWLRVRSILMASASAIGPTRSVKARTASARAASKLRSGADVATLAAVVGAAVAATFGIASREACVMPMTSMRPCSTKLRSVSFGCRRISLRNSKSLRCPSTRINALRSRGGRRIARVSISE